MTGLQPDPKSQEAGGAIGWTGWVKKAAARVLFQILAPEKNCATERSGTGYLCFSNLKAFSGRILLWCLAERLLASAEIRMTWIFVTEIFMARIFIEWPQLGPQSCHPGGQVNRVWLKCLLTG
jgi:hypothetical protein